MAGPAGGAHTDGFDRPGSSRDPKSGIATLWVKSDKNVISPVPVTIGIENGSNVEILDGLAEGAEVVIAMSGGGKKEQENRNRGPRGPFPF